MRPVLRGWRPFSSVPDRTPAPPCQMPTAGHPFPAIEKREGGVNLDLQKALPGHPSIGCQPRDGAG